MEWAPHTTVAAIIRQEDRFLMVEERTRNNDLLVINQPAGHLEDNERIVDALIREVLEETAWHVEPSHLVGIYKWRVPQSGMTYLRFCIAATPVREDASLQLDPDIVRTLWMAPENLKMERERLRSPMVLRCLDDYLAGANYPLELIDELS